MVEQIRLRTLLKQDAHYRAWFMKPPRLRVAHSTPPWRLFVQREQGGRWSRVDIRGYPKAYAEVRLRLSDVWDMTIHSKPQHFRPPVIRVSGKKFYMPMPEGHTWCTLCRRPTVFRYYERHQNLKPYLCNPEELRCGICGVRLIGIQHFRSPLNWPVTSDKL